MEICTLMPMDLEKFAHLFPPRLLTELPGDALLAGCVSDDGKNAAGILMAHVEENEVVVDWLYVDEPFRRKGGGRAMLQLLVQAAEASGEPDGVSVFFTQDDAGMGDFLKACGFMVLLREGGKGFSTTLGAFPRLLASGQPQAEILPVGDAPDAAREHFAGLLNDSVLPDIAVPTPFAFGDYRPESCVCMEKGIIRGLVLLQGDASGLSIPWIFNDSADPSAFVAAVNESMRRLKAAFPPDTPLTFASVDGVIEELIELHIPVAQRSEIYFGTYLLGL